jgi:hypothetical protein
MKVKTKKWEIGLNLQGTILEINWFEPKKKT